MKERKEVLLRAEHVWVPFEDRRSLEVRRWLEDRRWLVEFSLYTHRHTRIFISM